jgi:AcrR family transcriptional regulator
VGVRLDPAVRRKQILDAAISYFTEAGFGVQTRELARRIGISQPLLYRYFPSKNDLINAVFDAVFLSQWNENWITQLHDQSIPLRDRLLRFYAQYAQATYTPEWIRIYMYAGLAGLDFNRKYLGLVRTRLLTAMCLEFRLEFASPQQCEHVPEVSAREIELVWTLHGSMFYAAVRENIFNMKTPITHDCRAQDAIDIFLAGACSTYPRVLEQVRADRKLPREKSKGGASASS